MLGPELLQHVRYAGRLDPRRKGAMRDRILVSGLARHQALPMPTSIHSSKVDTQPSDDISTKLRPARVERSLHPGALVGPQGLGEDGEAIGRHPGTACGALEIVGY